MARRLMAATPRSGEGLIATGGSGENMKPACEKREKTKPGP
jgi:hypothetical protein